MKHIDALTLKLNAGDVSFLKENSPNFEQNSLSVQSEVDIMIINEARADVVLSLPAVDSDGYSIEVADMDDLDKISGGFLPLGMSVEDPRLQSKIDIAKSGGVAILGGFFCKD